jgi:hypothetical protein
MSVNHIVGGSVPRKYRTTDPKFNAEAFFRSVYASRRHFVFILGSDVILSSPD